MPPKFSHNLTPFFFLNQTLNFPSSKQSPQQKTTPKKLHHHAPPAGDMSGHRRHCVWLVPVFVITNLGLFVLSMYLNDCPRKSHDCFGADFLGRFSFESTRTNLMLGPAPPTLLKLGALDVKKVVEEREVWRLFSSIWLHAGVVHVLGNMISLCLVGHRLEQDFGCLRIGVLYIVSGIGGSLLSAFFIRTSISVGASGALFGLLGGMLAELITNWSTYVDKCCALISLLLIVALNMAFGILPWVNNFAHIGGFVTGYFLGFVLLIRPQYEYLRQKYAPPGYYGGKPKSKYKFCQCFLVVISLVIFILMFVLAFYYLLKGADGNKHCSWCHYLKCVPTPFWSCDPDKPTKLPQPAYCESTTRGDQLKLKCMGNGKTSFYTLHGNHDDSFLQDLCMKLCN